MIFWITLRSHFHYSRDALFGLWLQTPPSGLSNTATPSHSSHTTHLYTTKTVCMTAKWLHQLQYAASPCAWIQPLASEPPGFVLGLPTAPHTCICIPMAFGGEDIISCWEDSWKAWYLTFIMFFKLFETIYWKVLTQGISVFHLFSLVIAHILRILHWALVGIHQRCVLFCQG